MLSAEYPATLGGANFPHSHSFGEWQHWWEQVHQGLLSLLEIGHLPFLNLHQSLDRLPELSKTTQKMRQNYDSIVVVSHPYNLGILEAIIQAVPPPDKKKIFLLSTLPTPEMVEEFSHFETKDACFYFLWQSRKDEEHLKLSMSHSSLLQSIFHSLKSMQTYMALPQHLIRPGRLFPEAQLVESPPGIPWGLAPLSPTGLLPLEFLGISAASILQGALKIEKSCWNENFEFNPAGNLALQLWDLGQWRDLVFCFSNAAQMDKIVEWCSTLWNASLSETHMLSLPILSTAISKKNLRECVHHTEQKILLSFHQTENGANSETKIAMPHSLQHMPQFQFNFDATKLEDLGQLIFTWTMLLVYLGALFEIDIYGGLGIEKYTQTPHKH